MIIVIISFQTIDSPTDCSNVITGVTALQVIKYGIFKVVQSTLGTLLQAQ